MADTIQRAAARVIDAWDSTVLPVANDGRLQEAMEDLRAAMAERAAEQAEPVPAGYALVPVKATTAMLRPFYACPPEELELAWQALLIVAKNTAAPPAPARQEPPADWSVFNTGAEVAGGLTYAEALDYLTPGRLERGWAAVCVVDKDNITAAPAEGGANG